MPILRGFRRARIALVARCYQALPTHDNLRSTVQPSWHHRNQIWRNRENKCRTTKDTAITWEYSARWLLSFWQNDFRISVKWCKRRDNCPKPEPTQLYFEILIYSLVHIWIRFRVFVTYSTKHQQISCVPLHAAHDLVHASYVYRSWWYKVWFVGAHITKKSWAVMYPRFMRRSYIMSMTLRASFLRTKIDFFWLHTFSRRREHQQNMAV